jgi:class 3 adenylate cyclase
MVSIRMSFGNRLLAAMRKYPTGRWTASIQAIVEDELATFKAPVVREKISVVPDTSAIPLDNPSKWLEIPDIICCFVDMLGSTKLSVTAHPSTTAKFYRLFTSTAIRMFHELDAPYIDVKGDGVFALFDHKHSHRALAATVSFKTFVEQEFVPLAKKHELAVEGHYGIDKKSVLVRRMGKRRVDGRTDRQNEVWAGKPVNMAAKLAGLTQGGEILVSDRFHAGLTDDAALLTCGCPHGFRAELWSAVDLDANPLFDFGTAYRLKTGWCSTHGQQFCAHLLEIDEA